MFEIGKKVRLRDNPERIGTVESVRPVNGSVMYGVRFPDRLTRHDSSSLIEYKEQPSVIDCLLENQYGSYVDFQKCLTYMKISNSNAIQNNIYSLNTSRTTFYEYQYKPLMKFISSAKRRILICDEVGLGKTIETGIIMNELEARQELHNVLVVVPSNLQQKWYREMSSHFGMDFNIIRSKEFQGIISGDSKYARRYKHNRFIVSIESIRTGASLDVIEESEFHWDLLVLDEAHSIRNTSKQHNAIKALSINCDAIVFLTATPIHTENENLFNILSILDAQQFQQFNSFANQLRQNEPLVRALNYISRVPPDLDKVKEELGKVSPVFEDNYFYKAALKEIQALKKNKLSSQANSMDKLVNVQRNLSELHFLANSYTRTRKRDVMIDRPTRNANTVMVPFSPDEMGVYSSLVQAMKDSIRNKRSVDIFRLFNLQRMLSSSLAAFCGSAKGIELMEELLDPLEESEEILSSEDGFDSLPFRDSKLLKLLELMDIIKHKSKKVIIFAFYVNTLNYLEQMLKKHGYKVFIMHGRLDINRGNLISSFRDEQEFSVLLSSRVGSEGIDLQFCDTLINYDLPWNPMEVEQRIGRIDRIGQTSPVINIYNMTMEDTIDDEIVSRLYKRINLFESAIGTLEPILGELIDQITKSIFMADLTDDEKRHRCYEAEMILTGKQRDLALLEENSAEILSFDYYYEYEVKNIKGKNRYISPVQLLRFMQGFVNSKYNDCMLKYDLESNLGEMLLSSSFIKDVVKTGADLELPFMHHHFKPVKFTMDSTIAFKNDNLTLIHLMHPLVKYITQRYAEEGLSILNTHQFTIKGKELIDSGIDIAPGIYFYFIFLASFTGPRKTSYLEGVIMDESLNVIEGREFSEQLISSLIEHGANQIKTFTCDDTHYLMDAHDIANRIIEERMSSFHEMLKAKHDLAKQRKIDNLEYTSRSSIESILNQLAEIDLKLGRLGDEDEDELEGADNMNPDTGSKESKLLWRKKMLTARIQQIVKRLEIHKAQIANEPDIGLELTEPIMGGMFEVV